jgi:hypothetical protein
MTQKFLPVFTSMMFLLSSLVPAPLYAVEKGAWQDSSGPRQVKRNQVRTPIRNDIQTLRNPDGSFGARPNPKEMTPEEAAKWNSKIGRLKLGVEQIKEQYKRYGAIGLMNQVTMRNQQKLQAQQMKQFAGPKDAKFFERHFSGKAFRRTAMVTTVDSFLFFAAGIMVGEYYRNSEFGQGLPPGQL